MRVYREVTKVQDELDAVMCNQCGKIIESEDPFALNKIAEFHLYFSYGTNHDGETWRFDLCEDCIEKLVDKFKIPVTIERGLP
jgi:hypothetical protein